ncbi:unnamed protein product [Prorocentrum cordatum]|uniref:Uncharacterized protein n=1 Tax=Prorocentrum cordatum TaxID=2364126 RepID=A0ABN9WPC9_9DINO|nr:unnamed protein product [Polarella glacialis]
MRPLSGGSCRSRRDEVWEQKKQRFLAKQRAGGGGGPVGGGVPRASPPLHLGDHAGQARQPAPKSPLSRMVEEGYSAAQQPASVQKPYGSSQQSSGSRGARGTEPGGFSAAVASQWSSSVQHDQQQRQNRHDPSVVGPPKQSGGISCSQAPGGGASIDLSWGPTGGGGNVMPPRMPGAPGVGAQQPTPQHQRQQPAHQYPPRTGGSGGSYRGPSPSHRALGGAPWGRDGDAPAARQPSPARREAPFGTDAGAPAMPGRGASYARAPSPAQQAYARAPSPVGASAGFFGGVGQRDPAPSAGAPRGRGLGRTPGGTSQVVFG